MKPPNLSFQGKSPAVQSFEMRQSATELNLRQEI